jgi:hypothetical protein
MPQITFPFLFRERGLRYSDSHVWTLDYPLVLGFLSVLSSAGYYQGLVLCLLSRRLSWLSLHFSSYSTIDWFLLLWPASLVSGGVGNSHYVEVVNHWAPFPLIRERREITACKIEWYNVPCLEEATTAGHRSYGQDDPTFFPRNLSRFSR